MDLSKPKLNENIALVEYIWIDGGSATNPTKKLRSKIKVLETIKGLIGSVEDLPKWNFDGSSTNQAEGNFSDCELRPVCMIHDPIRGFPHRLALCEVYYYDDRPHESNTRALLKEASKEYEYQMPFFGIEQEHTLYDKDGGRPYGWPKQTTAFPGPQGGYYCGVGSDEVFGRNLIEAHLFACLSARLSINGINAEVMPAQWEFQLGPLGPLEISDQLWLARWILYRLGEKYEISIKLDPKPIAGDWNGAGAHTNFSTAPMRQEKGLRHIKTACRKLAKFHDEHIAVYGADNDKRLTGAHETCDIDTFRWGVGDRGASVRIPQAVADKGCGYLEDRRPAANMDPYEVCRALLETICGNGFKK
ncbi:glutamine synthetase [Patescibacteria group bacterium]